MEMLGEDEAMLRGQAEIWKLMFAFADSMALKCAIELRIPDIIHSHGGGEPMTLSHIASYIPSSSPSPEDSLSCLARIMRLLVRKDIFSVRTASDGSGEKLYGLTPSSRWLLQETRMSLTPMILMEDHPTLMLPWHCFSKCVKDGGIAFEIAHGRQIWDFASEDPTFNRLFNDGMACTSRIAIDAIVRWYKEGFERIGSLVDVGGGIGGAITEIVKSYPHIKGINFDLPHVIATAPAHPGVSHVGGDMFVAVPKADAVFMKVEGALLQLRISGLKVASWLKELKCTANFTTYASFCGSYV